MHDDGDRGQRDQGNRRKIPDGVVGQFCIKRGIDGLRPHRPHQQRLTIGRGPDHGLGADRAAGSCAIVDHDGSLEVVAQHLRERPRNDVGWSTGRKWNDDAELLAGKGLGLRRCHPRQQTDACCRQCYSQELSSQHGRFPCLQTPGLPPMLAVAATAAMLQAIFFAKTAAAPAGMLWSWPLLRLSRGRSAASVRLSLGWRGTWPTNHLVSTWSRNPHSGS
jgi:hypothetical protein